jgi:hypothetical protein
MSAQLTYRLWTAFTLSQATVAEATRNVEVIPQMAYPMDGDALAINRASQA